MIDTIFIEKAVAIREEYIKCMENIDIDEKKLSDCKDTIIDLINKGDELTENYEDNDLYSTEINEIIQDITNTINELQKNIQPYKDRVKELEKESDMLYIAIKDRYPELTQEDIKKQIIPHLKR